MINVLQSTQKIVKDSKYVHIDKNKIKKAVQNISPKDLEFTEISMFNNNLSPDDMLQAVFVFNSQTFCFWAEKNMPKWTIEIDSKLYDGSIALIKCMEKELNKNKDLLDADYLANISEETVKKIFKGNVEIPLLNERVECYQNIGAVLQKKYLGKYKNMIEEANYDALKLVEVITDSCITFNDKTKYDNFEVGFYKRAQLQVWMTQQILESSNMKTLTNTDKLTAFADYKIPQILRNLGILIYGDELAQKIDNFELIDKDSREEIEIRSNMIWAVEHIKDELGKKYKNVDSVHVDGVLWFLSQKPEQSKPYHRTYTINY